MTSRHSFDADRQAKIALKADSEDDLLELEAVAKSLNLCARAIHDASVCAPLHRRGYSHALLQGANSDSSGFANGARHRAW